MSWHHLNRAGAPDDACGMVHRRRLIALGAFATTICLAGIGALGSGLAGSPANSPVPIVATEPSTIVTPKVTPTTAPAPATTAAVATTAPAPAAPVPATTAAPTVPPATPRPATPAPPAAPRPPPTPVAPKVTAAPSPVAATPPAVKSSPGDPGDYALIGYRWNPCETVTLSSSGPDISGVVAELVSITGLHLQIVPSGGQITVGWGATPAGGEVGQTDWRSMGPWLVSANVTLNQVLGLVFLPTLLRHELGHALGLGHAAHANEIMYGVATVLSPGTYQAGDLAGLRAVGASAGC